MSDYIVECLIERHVTDVFGIPGGVILELIYAFHRRKEVITPHLSYHEQAAGFAACGYAQSSGLLGVAYATRGPGFTNLITAIADAYCDSIPTLFITAHASPQQVCNMRVMTDQEIDTCSMVRNITKYAKRIDDILDAPIALNEACDIAMTGRKGPVFIDIAADLFNKEIEVAGQIQEAILANNQISDIVKSVVKSICTSKRPVILIGDGVNQVRLSEKFRKFIAKANIPVLSSRYSHDIIGDSEYYYGYVGSHGIRAANFILAKTDLIVSIGNRLCFPVNSDSFRNITSRAKIIRFDIDETEFERVIPNSLNYNMDITPLLSVLADITYDYGNHSEWLETCNILKEHLRNEDVCLGIVSIADILKSVSSDVIIVNDVGNNEFMVSRACIFSACGNRVLYSKSFGALGCALGKSIGAYYAKRKPVLCFVGDQGLQINIQELQFIAQHCLPITIVLINNNASAMIKDRERIMFDGEYVHTTKESGYRTPNFQKIVEGYGIPFYLLTRESMVTIKRKLRSFESPSFIELVIEEDNALNPNLPKGRPCQDLEPQILREKFDYLNNL